MRIVIAPDKFKDCLTAPQVAEAMGRGAQIAMPHALLDLCPMADGGEGTVEALVAATGGRMERRHVTGPLPEMKVDAAFGILGDGQTAVVEMAAASGLALLKPQDRNPLNTTTFGTGELLLAAATTPGVTHIILGLGGSATCDAGLGCAQACGLPVILEDGQPLAPTEPLCGRDLQSVVLVKHGRGSPIERVKITVASDVTNPLFGPTGAACVYGPQKGASPDDIRQLDDDLRALAHRLGKLTEANTPGAGAAGGLGFGMLAFFGASLRPGFDLIAEATRLRDRLAGADLCLTGEGKFDASSLAGKTVAGVARLCGEMNVPCIALVGDAAADVERDLPPAFARLHVVRPAGMSVEASIQQAPALLAKAAEAAIRSFKR